MKPHPRIRKTVKWGGAAVTVLLVVVWIGSGWVATGWSQQTMRSVYLNQGALIIRWFTPADVTPSGTWRWAPHPWKLSWKSQYLHSRGVPPVLTPGEVPVSFETIAASFPLWWGVAVMLLITLPAWYFDALARRRARLGRCPKCNYDRTGLAAGAVCPECGKLPA